LIGQELSPALQAQIEELTGAAVGYDLARGDTISVVSIPFVEPEAFPSEPAAAFPWAAVLGWAALFLIIALGAFFILRRLRPARRPATVDMVVGGEQEEAVAIEEEEELPLEEKKRRQRQDFLQKLAKEKPEDVAALLKTWVLED